VRTTEKDFLLQLCGNLIICILDHFPVDWSQGLVDGSGVCCSLLFRCSERFLGEGCLSCPPDSLDPPRQALGVDERGARHLSRVKKYLCCSVLRIHYPSVDTPRNAGVGSGKKGKTNQSHNTHIHTEMEVMPIRLFRNLLWLIYR
jgi:hypothetical protein